MTSTTALPSSSILPYRTPPRLMENASAPLTYDWKALAACRSKDTEVQCGVSCLHRAPKQPLYCL